MHIIVFALPGLAFLGIYVLYPLIMDIITSFTNWSLTSFSFIGLANYAFMLKDPLFRVSLITNLLWLVISVPISAFLGLLFALLLTNPSVKLSVLWRTLIFMALAIPSTVAAYMYGYLLFASDTGFINAVIFHNTLDTFGSYWPALLMMLLASMWGLTAWATIVYMASIFMLPKEIIEASEIDGAGPLTRLFKIYIPLLKPAHIITIAMLSIMAMKVFSIIYTLYAPGGTDVLLYYMYDYFSQGFFGYANAVVTLMMIIVLVMAIPIVFLMRGGAR